MKNLTLSLFLTLIFLGCKKSEESNINETQFPVLIDEATKTHFDFSKPDGKMKGALAMLDEDERDRAFINSSEITTLSDINGKEHKVLLVLYTLDKNNITMAVPLNNHQSAKGSLSVNFLAPGCKQRCIASSWCTGCTLTVIEQCKSIDCKCSSGTGSASCDPEITVTQ